MGVIKGDASGGPRQTTMFRLGLAIGILFYAIVFAAILVFWSMSRQSQSRSSIYVLRTPIYSPKARMPEAEDKSGGGGGGGRNTSELPSKGSLPIFSPTNLIVAPRPENSLTPPVLPIIETVKVDPRIQVDRDDLMPTGMPDGASILPSAGPGTGGGIGTGSRGGIGSGDGYGVGPGRDEGIGGDWPGIGGKPKATIRQEVDERPVLLNQPRPFYTEEARRNKVQGVVRVRILIEASGAVKEVVVMRGLPDGLNEQAIRAAYQMRFKPAMKNGQPVVYWLNNVEVEFNLR
jgi:TonB family protein